ncbi:sulfatase-like hydrolase/transferase [Jiangella asiatica]|uniref:sulfatase-like hydrolase/transferase n=1 Tax=Jiangella asiatica TaxID=2530372 RepID=UPI0013A5C7C0|nr:sulfatase-like hydrolase/transferase [Jiangella asiatica]
MTTSRPDLIIFVADEWRGDALGHHNPVVATPQVDRLVESDAVSFSRAFCQNPICVPSRCSVLTGWYPHVRGHRTQHHLLREDEPNLLRRLREAGYFVWWAGKNDMLSPRAIDGSVDVRVENQQRPTGLSWAARWREWWPSTDVPGYYSFYAGRLPDELDVDDDRHHVDAAVDLILNRPVDQPLCVVLTLLTPHCPYGVAAPWYGSTDRRLVPDPLPRPAAGDHKPRTITELARRQGLEDWPPERWRELRATYYDMCTRTDAMFGEVVQAVRRSGRYPDTAIVLLADHGDFAGDFGLPEKAQNVFDDSLTRVPLVIKPPRDRAGRVGVTDALTELVDVTATIEELAGLERDYDHFGRSLLPLISDGANEHRPDVLCEGGRRESETHAAELASPQEPEGLYYPRMSLQREDPVAHGKATMIRTDRYKYVRRMYEDDEFYDLTLDPAEQRNLIHVQAAAGAIDELRVRLLDRMIATADVVPHHQDPR